MSARRQQDLAKGVHKTNEQRGKQRPTNRTNAANHHHHETNDQHRAAHARIDRRHGRGHHAGQHRNGHPGGKHHAVQKLDINAQRLHHLAVGAARADHHAQAGAGEHKVHAQRQRQAHARDKQAVDGVGHHVSQRNAAVQDVGRRHAVHVVAHQQAAQLFKHQNQTIGHQHLLQVFAFVQEAEKRPLQKIAKQHRQHHPHQQCGKKAAADSGAHHRCQAKRQISAHHIKAAVRQVDHAHDAEDQRQAGSHQKQQQPVLKRVQTLN